MAETFEQKTERNFRVKARYDDLMREGKHGHYETMFRVVREECERAALATAQASGEEREQELHKGLNHIFAHACDGTVSPESRIEIIKQIYEQTIRALRPPAAPAGGMANTPTVRPGYKWDQTLGWVVDRDNLIEPAPAAEADWDRPATAPAEPLDQDELWNDGWEKGFEYGSGEPPQPSEEDVARAIYELDPFYEGGEYVDGFQVSPGGALTWEQAKARDAEFEGDKLLLPVTKFARDAAAKVMALLRG